MDNNSNRNTKSKNQNKPQTNIEFVACFEIN